jgi:hypothetical protein
MKQEERTPFLNWMDSGLDVKAGSEESHSPMSSALASSWPLLSPGNQARTSRNMHTRALTSPILPDRVVPACFRRLKESCSCRLHDTTGDENFLELFMPPFSGAPKDENFQYGSWSPSGDLPGCVKHNRRR